MCLVLPVVENTNKQKTHGIQSGMQGIAFMWIISDKVVSFTKKKFAENKCKNTLKKGKLHVA